MKLLRPYIDIRTRCIVATRQCGWSATGIPGLMRLHQGHYGRLLQRILAELGEKIGTPLHLDHDPALENRPFNKRTRKYTPDANDPDYLFYRSKQSHRIKTLVRGDGALRSDASQRRYLKKVAKNRAGVQPVKRGVGSRRKSKVLTRKWFSRPLRSASRWPKNRKFGRG